MKLPQLEHPDRYAGLFVVDFGDTCSVGYTAEEVAWLLESEAHASAKVYRIQGAGPEGTLELKGVPASRFRTEAGLFFHARTPAAARSDFESIRALAEAEGFPCRAQLLLGSLETSARLPWVVGVAYPAECDEDVSAWMLAHDVRAGEYADGGVGRLQAMREALHVIETASLRPPAGRRARRREEVLAAVGRPVQRTA